MLSLIILLFVCLTSPVLAQSPEAALESELITQPGHYDQLIQEAQLLYSQELEKYRSLERVQLIAADQYQSLNTLAALEDLVLKTKSLALSRDLVLKYYFTLLKLHLEASTGVELSLKDQYLLTLSQAIGFLEAHYDQLEVASNKDELQAALTAFEQLGDPEGFSQQVLAILEIAKLQAVYDLAIPLKNEIDNSLSNNDRLDQAAIKRASDQTANVLSQVDTNLKALWLESSQKNFLKSIYSSPTQELNPVYVALLQSLTYFKELLGFN